mmetsp:Transcript_7040/g.20354  ORF Transcript_7040/g.20354 Transcript_7040/m.20354 type:complete len:232 (+) Transcript_7040:562-1257(+)
MRAQGIQRSMGGRTASRGCQRGRGRQYGPQARQRSGSSSGSAYRTAQRRSAGACPGTKQRSRVRERLQRRTAPHGLVPGPALCPSGLHCKPAEAPETSIQHRATPRPGACLKRWIGSGRPGAVSLCSRPCIACRRRHRTWQEQKSRDRTGPRGTRRRPLGSGWYLPWRAPRTAEIHGALRSRGCHPGFHHQLRRETSRPRPLCHDCRLPGRCDTPTRATSAREGPPGRRIS